MLNHADLQKIGNLIDSKLESKLEEKLESKLKPINQKLDLLDRRTERTNKLLNQVIRHFDRRLISVEKRTDKLDLKVFGSVQPA